jgi:hypothetical protein
MNMVGKMRRLSFGSHLEEEDEYAAEEDAYGKANFEASWRGR